MVPKFQCFAPELAAFPKSTLEPVQRAFRIQTDWVCVLGLRRFWSEGFRAARSACSCSGITVPLYSGLELDMSQAPCTSLDLAMPLGSEKKIPVLLAGHAPGLSRSAGSVSAFPSSVQKILVRANSALLI